MRKAKQKLKPAHHHAHMRHAARKEAPLYTVRRSRIHGSGVHAARQIPKGTRIVEYLGDRISHAQADARYEAKGQDDGHTFLFVVSSKVVIDAGVDGNEARFINHSCDPNCETVIEGGRVFIEALRDIAPGEELGYEYGLTWESTDDPDELANYACRCGAAGCRGTMLDPVPLDKKRKQQARRKAARKKAVPARGKARK
jgi:SET domain-containing protein